MADACVPALRAALRDAGVDGAGGGDDDTLLGMVASALTFGLANLELADLLTSTFPAFSRLNVSAKSALVRRLQSIVKAGGHAATETAAATAAPPRAATPRAAAAAPPQPAVPSSFWGDTDDAAAGDVEEVVLQVPTRFLPAVETVRGVLPDCPLERVVAAVAAAGGDADEALARLCDAEERARWAGSESAAVSSENAAEYARVIAQLRGGSAGGGGGGGGGGCYVEGKGPPAGGARGGRGGGGRGSSTGGGSGGRGQQPQQPQQQLAGRAPLAAAAPSLEMRASSSSALASAAEKEDALVAALRGLLAHLSPDEAAFALARQRGGGLEAAAAYALESDFPSDLALWRAAQQRAAAPPPTAAAPALGAGGRRAASGAAPLSFGGGYGGDEEEARDLWAVKHSVLRRYDERPDTSDKTYRPALPAEMQAARARKGEKTLRYLDGQAVFLRRGEKYVVEKPPEGDAGTFVALKIKRKRAAGPSPGFK